MPVDGPYLNPYDIPLGKVLAWWQRSLRHKCLLAEIWFKVFNIRLSHSVPIPISLFSTKILVKANTLFHEGQPILERIVSNPDELQGERHAMERLSSHFQRRLFASIQVKMS
jgi:hypothetical protein